MNFEEYKQNVIDKTEYYSDIDYGYSVPWRFYRQYYKVVTDCYIISIKNFNGKVLKLPTYVDSENIRFTFDVPDSSRYSIKKHIKLTYIKDNVLSDCKNLTDIIIPNNGIRLKKNTFSGCVNLERITLPKNIKTIEKDTFKDCKKLNTIYYEGTEEEFEKIFVYNGKNIADTKTLGLHTPIKHIHDDGNDSFLNAKVYFNCCYVDDSVSDMLAYEDENTAELTEE